MTCHRHKQEALLSTVECSLDQWIPTTAPGDLRFSGVPKGNHPISLFFTFHFHKTDWHVMYLDSFINVSNVKWQKKQWNTFQLQGRRSNVPVPFVQQNKSVVFKFDETGPVFTKQVSLWVKKGGVIIIISVYAVRLAPFSVGVVLWNVSAILLYNYAFIVKCGVTVLIKNVRHLISLRKCTQWSEYKCKMDCIEMKKKKWRNCDFPVFDI